MKSNCYLLRRLGRDLKAGTCYVAPPVSAASAWQEWVIRDEKNGKHYIVPRALRPTWGKYRRRRK